MRKSKERKRFDWHPEWNEAFEGWTVKFVKANLWRVWPHLDFGDLFQECALKFAYCADRRPDICEPRGFMALYKQACHNHLKDFAMKRKKPLPALGSISEDADPSELVADDSDPFEEVDLLLAIEAAPSEVQTICHAALEGKGGYAKLPRTKKRGRRWETRRQLLARLAGGNEEAVELFRDWFLREFGAPARI